MSRHYRIGGALALALTISACTSTMKATPLTGAGRFDTTSRVDAANITTKAPFDKGKYGKLAYVKSLGDNKTINQFFLQSVTNSHVFETVMGKDELEQMVIKRNIDSAGTPDSLIGLHKLAEAIGPFLILEPYVEWKGGYNYEASIKAIDPATGDTVFQAKKKAFNWAGLDAPLFYPLFNAFLEWAQGSDPAVAAPVAARP